MYKKIVLCFLCTLCFYSCEQPPGGAKHVPDSDATLKSLTISAGNLSPAFNAATTSYSAVVNNVVDKITVTGVPSSAAAAAGGDSGTEKDLEVGSANFLAVTVTAESGAAKTYTVTVTRLDGATRLIESAADMAKIGVNDEYPPAGDYVLGADIELENWTPIGGDSGSAFTGNFDGSGYTIALKSFDAAAVRSAVYIGIFGYVKGGEGEAKAGIKNLAIHSSINAVSTMETGQAAGLLAGCAENTEITGIALEGGFVFKSDKNIYLGGIVGYAQKGAVIEGCESGMDMNIDAGNGQGLEAGMYYNFVGGFAGLFKDGVDIRNCHNSGDVKADCTASYSQVFCGGIAGGSYYAFSTEYQGSIQDCSFTGNISAKSKGYWSWAGGIAGCIVGDGDGTLEKTTRILRCFAGGTVSVEDSEADYPYAGGIVGYNYYGALTAQSYFTGAVISNTGGNYTGGIAGYNSKQPGHNSRIEDCWSGGTVTGFNNAGGIVGQNQVDTYVRRCYSVAVVSVTDTCETNKASTNPGVGGIAGFNVSTLQDAITGCVALNPSVSAAGGTKIHRVVGWRGRGDAGALGRNLAGSGMDVNAGSGTYTPDIGAGKADGEDCGAKPGQSVYEELGWNFSSQGGVWKMGPDGYPALKWQNP
jgi:hypothetical protein